MDLAGGSVGLVVAAPIIAGVALAIRFQLGRPVLFVQERVGRDGRVFDLCKFRTMLDATDEQGRLLPDEARVTPLGQLLRRYSLDELPTLFNVLKGDMSLVGPRPLLTQYLDLYTPEQARRHEVKPGVTGWVQVNGRNDLSWEEKFALDVWYVDHWTLLLDTRILLRTIGSVLSGHGVSKSGYATTDFFRGSQVVGRTDAASDGA